MQARNMPKRFLLALFTLIFTGLFVACSGGNSPGTSMGSSPSTPGISTSSTSGQATGPVVTSTPDPVASPTNSRTPKPTPGLTPRPTSPSKVSPTPTAPSASSGSLHFPCASPGGCGFPDASDTGVPAGTKLTPKTGNLEIRTNGTIIKDVKLTGSLDVYANNVTIEDSQITSTNWWGINLRAGYSNITILHCTITGVVGKGVDGGGEDYGINIAGAGSIEIAYNNLSEFADIIQLVSGNIHDNYVHDTQSFHHANNGSITHTDPFIDTGGNTSPLTVNHNTFLNQGTLNQGPSSAVALYDDFGTITNTTVEDNWLAGGSYALYGGNKSSSNVHILKNVFSTQYWKNSGIYGSVAYWYPANTGNVFSGNVYANGSSITCSSNSCT